MSFMEEDFSMRENQVSHSALITAYFRAYHAIHDVPKIFDDFGLSFAYEGGKRII